jgi:outer membrane protein assembly factor BamB
MFRPGLALILGILWAMAADLRAQRSFPSPNLKLHDAKHKVNEPAPPAAGKYQIQEGRVFVRADPTPTRINSLAFSRDGKLLAAAKDYGRIVVWDVASRRVFCVIDTGFTRVGLVAFSPDGHSIAATQLTGGGIRIWQIPDGKLVSSIDAGSPVVGRLLYASNPGRLIFAAFSALGTSVLDPASGAHMADFPGERMPVVSTDGNTLMTVSNSAVILRSVSDLKQQRTLPKLTPYAWPVFMDTELGLYLFGDGTDSHLFVAARLSDGQMPRNVKLANLPKSTALYETSAFAAIDPHSGLVLGHSGDQLWALNPKTGDTCLSPHLLSVSGAMSADGRLLAGAEDSSTPTENQEAAGVAIWKTDKLAKACHLQ